MTRLLRSLSPPRLWGNIWSSEAVRADNAQCFSEFLRPQRASSGKSLCSTFRAFLEITRQPQKRHLQPSRIAMALSSRTVGMRSFSRFSESKSRRGKANCQWISTVMAPVIFRSYAQMAGISASISNDRATSGLRAKAASAAWSSSSAASSSSGIGSKNVFLIQPNASRNRRIFGERSERKIRPRLRPC